MKVVICIHIMYIYYIIKKKIKNRTGKLLDTIDRPVKMPFLKLNNCCCIKNDKASLDFRDADIMREKQEKKKKGQAEGGQGASGSSWWWNKRKIITRESISWRNMDRIRWISPWKWTELAYVCWGLMIICGSLTFHNRQSLHCVI